MITLDIAGEQVQVKPRSLQNFISKIDYIKSRRVSPYSCLRGLPPEESTPDRKQKYIESAMMISMKMSSVSFEEELLFDNSYEGFFYAIWQSTKDSIDWPKDSQKAVDAAEKWFRNLSEESQTEVRMALKGVDHRLLSKNSGGPEENKSPGPETKSE